MIRVLVDSSSDYPKEELAEKKIEMVPLIITVGDDKTYRDELDLSKTEIYELLIEGKYSVKTSQASPQDFLDVFEDVKAKGDEMICLLLSSALSGTYQTAQLAKNMVGYDKIYIVDTFSATLPVKMMADYAMKMANDGMSCEGIVKRLEEKRSKFRVIAALDTLKYLYLGGRVSKTTAVVADTVNIKPGITLTKEGTVGIDKKYLGTSRAVKDLAKQVKAAELDPDFPVYVIYSHVEDNAMKLIKSLKVAGIQYDKLYELGATLGVHIGPGAYGVAFVEK